MPKWVKSRFEVTGAVAELDRFRKLMFVQEAPPPAGGSPRTWNGGRGTHLDFTGILPAPVENGADDFEEWALSCWGTFWNARDCHILEESPGRLLFAFDTAWDFPKPVFEALATEFPKLVFTGSAYEQRHEFAFEGQFNGDRPWGQRP